MQLGEYPERSNGSPGHERHNRVGFGDCGTHALGYVPPLIDMRLEPPAADPHGRENLSETERGRTIIARVRQEHVGCVLWNGQVRGNVLCGVAAVRTMTDPRLAMVLSAPPQRQRGSPVRVLRPTHD